MIISPVTPDRWDYSVLNDKLTYLAPSSLEPAFAGPSHHHRIRIPTTVSIAYLLCPIVIGAGIRGSVAPVLNSDSERSPADLDTAFSCPFAALSSNVSSAPSNACGEKIGESEEKSRQ